MNKPLAKTYKRNQVEQAVWSLFSQTSGRDPIPRPFRTRIKRLLELDREKQAETRENFAFFDAPAEGKGVEVVFSPFNAFCLTLGLDLLDIGFKQSEVVSCLQILRDKFEWLYDKIWENPPHPAHRIRVWEDTDLPVYIWNGKEYLDTKVFILIRKVELREAWPLVKGKDPLILEPVICFGTTEAREELLKMTLDFRSYVILELSEIAVLVKKHLEETPARKRGR